MRAASSLSSSVTVRRFGLPAACSALCPCHIMRGEPVQDSVRSAIIFRRRFSSLAVMHLGRRHHKSGRLALRAFLAPAPPTSRCIAGERCASTYPARSLDCRESTSRDRWNTHVVHQMKTPRLLSAEAEASTSHRPYRPPAHAPRGLKPTAVAQAPAAAERVAPPDDLLCRSL